MVNDDNFVCAARTASVRVLCVSRPGCGRSMAVDQGPAGDHEVAYIYGALGCRSNRATTSMGARLATHTADVAAVLRHLGVTKGVRVIGVCAGTPYALHFFSCHPELICTAHLTLVTPWCPIDCPHHKSLFQLAGRGWFGPRSAMGNWMRFASAFSTTFVLRGPADAYKMTSALSTSEQAEFERQCAADQTRAARFVEQLRSHVEAYSLHGTRGDISTCLATEDELDLPAGAIGTIDATRVSIFAAEKDRLISAEATEWFAQRFARSAVALRTFVDASHMGAVQLRTGTWLEAASHDGELQSHESCVWRQGECMLSMLP